MKFKIETYNSTMLRMLAATLVTNRKLCDLIIVSQAKGDVNLAVSLSSGFRHETEVATEALIDKIYENEGDISIDDILGKET